MTVLRLLRPTMVATFAILALTAPLLHAQQYQWRQSPVNGHIYALTAPSSWTAAEAEARAAGGHLATVRSAAEQAWLEQAFPAMNLWIGFSDQSVEGQWRWSSGEPVTYTNWCVGEPNNLAGGTEHFAHLRHGGLCMPYGWNDASDSAGPYPGVIEMEPAVPVGDYALRFDADGSRVEFPHRPAMNTGGAATVEFWYRISGSATPVRDLLLERYSPSAEHKALQVQPDGSVAAVYAGSPWPEQHSGSQSPDDDWHHAAFVRRLDGTWTIFHDGQPAVSGGPGPCWTTCDVLNAVTPTRIVGGVGWDVDAVRWSSVDRYSGPFTPVSRWLVDSSTVLQLDFDEGSGVAVSDSSAAAQSGAIQGAISWVDGVAGTAGAYAAYRQSCASSSGTPVLEAVSLPRVGRQLRIRVTGLGAHRVGYLLFGFRDDLWGLNSLPLELTVIGAPGCWVNIDPATQFLVPTDASGTANATYPVPTDPTLVGTVFYNQFVSIDDAPPGRALRITTTNAGRGRIGL